MTDVTPGPTEPGSPISAQAESLAVEANRLREAGALDDAIARFTEALAMWRALGQRAEAATPLVGLGWTHHQAGRDEAALGTLGEGPPDIRRPGAGGGGVVHAPPAPRILL